MRVAVVTPYFLESRDVIMQCLDSVQAQTHPCTHIVVADGHPQDWLDERDLQHLALPVAHKDYGDAPRGIGSVTAISQGFDAIAYLDGDNWYHPQHIASMVDLHERTGASVCTSRRDLHRIDGSLMGPCTDVDGEHFVDTSCYFLARQAFNLVPIWWSTPADLHCVTDRLIWGQILARKLSRADSGDPTVAYRTAFEWHYHRFSERPPPGSKTGAEIGAALRRLRALSQARPRV